MTRDEAMTPVELTPLEDAIATAIYDYQRSVGLDDEAAGEDAFGIMRAVHTVIQQAFAERGDDAGRELYLRHTSNDPFMHCNRFLLWDELSVEEQAKWNTRAAIARSMKYGD